eukprot:g32187.t1
MAAISKLSYDERFHRLGLFLLEFRRLRGAAPRELTEEEKQQILHSEEFLIFFDHNIRIIERALAEDSSLFFDYGGKELDEKE